MSYLPSVAERITELRGRLSRGEYPLATTAQLDTAERIASNYAVVCGEAYIAEPDAADGHVNVGAVAGGGTAHVTLVYPDGTSRVPDGWGEISASAVDAARLRGAFCTEPCMDEWLESMLEIIAGREPVNVRVTFADDTERTVTASPERDGGWHACSPCGSMTPVYATPRDAAIAHVRNQSGPLAVYAEVAT